MTLDNSKSQIEEEKGADENHRHEKEEGPRSVSFHVHDHHNGPAFQTDALENSEQRPENVVKISDIIVWIKSLLAAVVAFRAWSGATDSFFSVTVDKNIPSFYVHTALLKHAHEQVESTDRKDQEKEEEDNDGVRKERNGKHDG